ncbi:hypothetical protein HYC85_000404 [Camellia sinensis]|uniref:Cationic amino acid transporter C-terminal domain-containing protein n=1 Tax=Camellia sinensis TaxID=4442 RepID=A0A7J7I380_CAMSI|nr:hypothetical protein HYC85_000404 [Camellia sinensis]
MDSRGSSFSSFNSYLRALADTPSRLGRRAASVSTSFEEMSQARARSGSDMRRTLRWFDLVGFGIGGMVGAGVFVTTGQASHQYSGPSVILSYAIAGFCALLSAFCYTEFAVEMPVAGGAFSYIRVTFGEFAAFLTGANLIIDYVLSNAAVARSFTAYLGTAIGLSTATKWRVSISSLPKGFNEIDFVAVAVVLFITLIICYSTRESSVLNMVLTTLHILFIVFVIVVGFYRGDSKNFTKPGDPSHPGGFFPFGAPGVFNGAAMVYLSYIGYDAVSTMAEEVQNPVKDIPIGVSGSVIVVTVFYCLMAASMSMLLPYDMINKEAPFAEAFRGGSGGWRWVSNVIGVGASFGILTSMLVAMMGQARYMCVIGRSSVVPAWFAKIHPKTSTPVNASVFLESEVFGEEVGYGGVVDGAYGDGGAAVDLGGEVGDGEVVVEGGEVGVVLDVGGGGELAAGGDVVGHPTLEENGLQFGPGRVDGGCVGGGATADDAEAGLEGLKVVHDGGGAGGRGGRHFGSTNNIDQLDAERDDCDDREEDVSESFRRVHVEGHGEGGFDPLLRPHHAIAVRVFARGCCGDRRL